jgi:hypothetical protein
LNGSAEVHERAPLNAMGERVGMKAGAR